MSPVLNTPFIKDKWNVMFDCIVTFRDVNVVEMNMSSSFRDEKIDFKFKECAFLYVKESFCDAACWENSRESLSFSEGTLSSGVCVFLIVRHSFSLYLRETHV